MNPRYYKDKLLGWAAKLELPVLSLDNRKAPEYLYLYVLNKYFDIYWTLIVSQGRCIGLSGSAIPRVIVTGDSTGGNIAIGIILLILESNENQRYINQEPLPLPEGLILIYPGLDMNICN